MKNVLFFMLMTTAVTAQEIAEEVYKYVATPVTDSTWNLDVVNVAVSPQTITRYSNMSKSDMEEYFYKRLINAYDVIAINNYKMIVEEIKNKSLENILTQNMEFDYASESVNKFKNTYNGVYNFAKTNDVIKVVEISDGSMYHLTPRVDTLYKEVFTTVYDTSYVQRDSVVTDSIGISNITLTDTIITPTTVTSVDTVYSNNVSKTKIYDIVPVSNYTFNLVEDSGFSVTIYTENKKSWIGKDEQNNELYYFKKR